MHVNPHVLVVEGFGMKHELDDATDPLEVGIVACLPREPVVEGIGVELIQDWMPQ